MSEQEAAGGKQAAGNRERLTVAEVARRMAVQASVVLAWIASGDLLAVNTASRIGPGHRPRWRVRPEDLAAFERRRQNARPSDASDQPARRRPAKRQPAGEEFV